MAGAFISRQVKASWGIPCNQNANGELFVGKGFVVSLASQLPEIASRVERCLAVNRDGRNGRFWLDKAKEEITMMVGEASENTYLTRPF